MELLIERCAGLDVHKASVTATVRIPDQAGGRLQQTRAFRATTAGLVLLGDWLASFGVTVVGMDSTCGLSQQAAEAGGSPSREAPGRVGAAPTTTGRVSTAR